MSKNRKKYQNSDTDRFSKQVTLPVSDTVPAPGNYSIRVLNMNGSGLPVVDSTDLINTTGAGTAKDVVSVNQAPVPGDD